MPAPVSAEVCAVALCVGKAEGPGSQAETLGHSQWVTLRGFYAAQRTRVTPRACVPRIIHTKRKWRDCSLQLTFADIFPMLCMLPGSFLPRIWGRSKSSSNAACCTFLTSNQHKCSLGRERSSWAQGAADMGCSLPSTWSHSILRKRLREPAANFFSGRHLYFHKLVNSDFRLLCHFNISEWQLKCRAFSSGKQILFWLAQETVL